MRRQGSLAGVLPLAVRRTAITTPTNWHTPGFSPVAEDEEARERLADILFSRTRGRLELSFLPADDPMLAACRAAARRRGYRTREHGLLRSPVVSIAGDWATFEARLDSHFRSELRRRGRRLAEMGSVELALEPGGDALDVLLAEGFRLEASGWKGARGSAIRSRPDTEGFYRDVAKWSAERGVLRLAFLRLDGRALAFEFCLRDGGIQYNLKGGYDGDYQRFAPSKLLHRRMLERAFADGLSSYEFLGSDDPWKLEWTGHTRQVQAFQAFGNTPYGLAQWGVVANLDLARRIRKRLRAHRSRLAK